MATATFSSEHHIYEHEGVVIPSVTQVLTLAGIDDVSHVPIYYLERGAAIGTAVHQACEFLDQEDLDLDSLDSTIVGYVLGYQKFKQEHGFFPLSIEQRGIGETNGIHFGFCVDRIGIIDGEQVLLDIKTSSRKSPCWPIQTAGYAEGVNCDAKRLIVHVAKDGSYKLLKHDDPMDFEVWLAALNIAHWKLRNGGKIR